MKFQSKAVKISGESFTVKELSARQRKDLFKLYNDKTDPVEVQAHTIQMGVDSLKEKSIEELLDMPGSVFGKLSEAVLDVSGLSDGAQEDEVKNS